MRRSIYRPYLEMPRVRKWWRRHGNHFYAYADATDMINEMIEEIEARESSREPAGQQHTIGDPGSAA